MRDDVEPSGEGLAEPLVERVEQDRLPLERQKLLPMLPEFPESETDLEEVKRLKVV